MIEVRTYDGDASELSAFTVRAWRSYYDGVISLPVWTEPYFDWQLFALRSKNAEFMVGAYDGARLVGCIMAEPFLFQLDGKSVPGTQGSWTTIDPDYKGRGIASRMVEELGGRHHMLGAKFLLGYLVAGSHSELFWRSMPDTIVGPRVRFWARILDYRAVSEWSLSFLERFGARVIGSSRRRVPLASNSDEFRDYCKDDLEDCFKLIQLQQESAKFGYRWSRSRLAHQLHYKGFPTTIVRHSRDQISGFINYYRLDMAARTFIPAGMIDLVVTERKGWQEYQTLLNAALRRMHSDGLAAASVMRLSHLPRRALWDAGFVPLVGISKVGLTYCDPTIRWGQLKPMHICWR